MSGRRAERVGEAVREVIAEMLLREIKDPRIGMVTVTAVELSDDLKHGKVYFSCLGDETVRQRSLNGLQSAAGFMKAQVARRLKLRSTPDLMFVFDPSLETAGRLSTLLNQTRAKPE